MIRKCISPYCKKMIFGHRFSGYHSEQCMDEYLDIRLAMKADADNSANEERMAIVLDYDICGIMPCDIYIGDSFAESTEDYARARKLLDTINIYNSYQWKGLRETAVRSAIGNVEDFLQKGFIVRGDDGYYWATYRLIEYFHEHTYP